MKRPKLFFWDTGLASHLAGIRDAEALESGPLGGPMLETLVVAEILKGAAHRGTDLEAFFFRESNGLEADLVLLDRQNGRRSARSPSRRVIIYQGETKRDWPSPGFDYLNMREAISEWQGEVA